MNQERRNGNYKLNFERDETRNEHLKRCRHWKKLCICMAYNIINFYLSSATADNVFTDALTATPCTNGIALQRKSP